MKQVIRARVYLGEKQYVGECLDFPVVTQGDTLDTVTANLKEAIELYFEGHDPEEFDVAKGAPFLVSLELSRT